MTRTLSERLRSHEQRRARLAEAEAKLKLDERKERTRRLVQAGALVEKAGLLGLDSNALYGALLSLTDDAADLSKVATWATLGGRRFAAEARARDEGRRPMLLTFPAPLAKDATTTLRRAGFRYSRVLQHWEGLIRPEEAETLARAHGGTARHVRATGEAAATSPARAREAAE